MKYQIIKYKVDPARFTPFVRFVNRCIGFFTGSKFWHVTIILKGTKYESGHPHGVSKRINYTHIPNKYKIVEEHETTEEQIDKMIVYAERKLIENLRYNHYKLISLALFYPTKFIWNKVKWVAFKNDYFGMVCSVFVREILLAGGIDKTPKLYKEITAPKDC
jgi:hypothetical protein